MTSKFTINHVNIISSWTYILPNNVDCTICCTSLNLPSIYNQSKGQDSLIRTKLCGHSYHTECIMAWLQYQEHCPICAVKCV
jgi:hypothetical protein